MTWSVSWTAVTAICETGVPTSLTATRPMSSTYFKDPTYYYVYSHFVVNLIVQISRLCPRLTSRFHHLPFCGGNCFRKRWGLSLTYPPIYSHLVNCGDLNKTASILLTTISNAFPSKKMFLSWSKYHWSLILKVQWPMSQDCFRQRFGIDLPRPVLTKFQTHNHFSWQYKLKRNISWKDL